jgi:hypothetical protein|tara:strand:- start:62 stop:670 length:609 start_codon:yes stop_codon:yes gene_type:complete
MLIEHILKEGVSDIAVFYGGRFQPMHKAHQDVYNHLVNKFGADNVFIATSFSQKAIKAHSKGDYSSDPFTFDEKASIMNKMFNIPGDKIIKTNPYRPDLAAIGKDPETTATILVYGAKDADRLATGTGFLHKMPDNMDELIPTAQDRGYVYVAPLMQGGMSASDFRQTMASEASPEQKQQEFTKFFGKMDPQVFGFIEERLT